MLTLKTLHRRVLLTVIATSLPWVASQASAHARVESTIPAAGTTVSSPKTIQVHFSESIEPKLSGLKLAGSDGSAVAVMSMNDPKDPTTLSIMPNAVLRPGAYTVTWSVVSDDGHKTQGVFTFTVQ